MSGSASSIQTSAQPASAAAIGQSLVMLLAGACLIFLVGFAPVSAVHNAAHDTRHASGFPCH
ncbi:MAG TPA: CbtB-domain containing protein [Dongiaceae bacterium]|nr:CbtB-domain containing protein [Dongiaceae bacterium]